MDVESLRKTLALVCKREPSLLLDILDSPQDTNPAQEHMTTAPSWCTCSFCRERPTMQENVLWRDYTKLPFPACSKLLT